MQACDTDSEARVYGCIRDCSLDCTHGEAAAHILVDCNEVVAPVDSRHRGHRRDRVRDPNHHVHRDCCPA